jgi:predicted alpha/beta superfamily hydrolase
MKDNFPPITIHDSELRFLKSTLLGKDYKIRVALPAGYIESKETYPVLYVLDADIWFGGIVEIVRHMAACGKMFSIQTVPDMIVVGIGYPLDPAKPSEYYAGWSSARAKDFSPTKDPAAPYGLSALPLGGANDFLAFIRDDLKPFINSSHRANAEDSTVYGASLGGLFALYVLFHRPDTFNRYIAISPSWWWDKKVTFDYERKYANEHTELPARLFLSQGSLEKDDVNDGVQDLQEFVQILKKRNYKGLEYASHIYEGEDHLLACQAATGLAIFSVFSTPKKD